jgi:hypothetical protein
MVPLRDGRLFCVPWSANAFVLVDIVHGAAIRSDFGVRANLGLPSTAPRDEAIAGMSTKWANAYAMADGSVCGFGSSLGAGYHRNCFRFDPASDRLGIFNYPRDIQHSIRAGAVLADGSVLLAPYTGQGAGALVVAWVGELPHVPCTASPVVNRA